MGAKDLVAAADRGRGHFIRVGRAQRRRCALRIPSIPPNGKRLGAPPHRDAFCLLAGVDNLERVIFCCLPTTTMTKEPGFIVPRRSPGAGGSKSAAGRKMLWVLRSRPMVRALRLVGTFSTTVNLSGESSCTTVRLPSPQEAKA